MSLITGPLWSHDYKLIEFLSPSFVSLFSWITSSLNSWHVTCVTRWTEERLMQVSLTPPLSSPIYLSPFSLSHYLFFYGATAQCSTYHFYIELLARHNFTLSPLFPISPLFSYIPRLSLWFSSSLSSSFSNTRTHTHSLVNHWAAAELHSLPPGQPDPLSAEEPGTTETGHSGCPGLCSAGGGSPSGH